ncbi:MAG: molecular chaperone TorD family protein [Deltaproteobacteria bacterium]|nr:molecular chaperone TorD family protein [Deltaproteobacteria bacterium]MBW2397199.1 molecular chaperone TorD family protein [Deltaproteobacteria bacterium]
MSPNDPCAEDIAFNLDRARVYRGLAQLFRAPDAEWIRTTRDRDLPELCQALERLTKDDDLVGEARTVCDLFEDTGVEKLRRGHQRAFDESSGTRCAPTEMDQLGGAPQLELTRTFEMADVAGFYKAFGVEAREGAERGDHIVTELEFMNLLAVKQAIALQDEGEGEHSEVCRNASRAFLRDHLGRWAPRLGECLAAANGDPIYSSAGRLLGGFVAFDAEKIDAAGAPLHRVAIKDI